MSTLMVKWLHNTNLRQEDTTMGNKQVEVAKAFIEQHKESDVTEWQPYFDDSDEQYITIYSNLVAGEYGEVHITDDGTAEIEITETRSGNPLLFNFDQIC